MEMVTVTPSAVSFGSSGGFLTKSRTARVNVFHGGQWHAISPKVYRDGQWTDLVDAKLFINGQWVQL